MNYKTNFWQDHPAIYQNPIWDCFDDDQIRIASAMLAHAVARSHQPVIVDEILAGVERDLVSAFQGARGERSGVSRRNETKYFNKMDSI
jgi:hypothetical protein